MGTPFCVTYDFDSENDHAITVRDRDTMQQEKIAMDKVVEYLQEKFAR
ncbi:MAG TPA: His/Gly/Thr/Pro-type tRNA ligase C-terminal domain-containing protein [Spirochaetales bacterium]|nr:His/Gly/Thr/Pro-type tRNA ligase C-terminal domain-containing protein [Spirochaetales bacterium]